MVKKECSNNVNDHHLDVKVKWKNSGNPVWIRYQNLNISKWQQIRRNVKLFLCIPWRGSGAETACFLNLSCMWRWIVSFMPWLLYLWRKSPVTHWIGIWIDPRVGLDTLETRILSCACWESGHISFVVQPANLATVLIFCPGSWMVQEICMKMHLFIKLEWNNSSCNYIFLVCDRSKNCVVPSRNMESYVLHNVTCQLCFTFFHEI